MSITTTSLLSPPVQKYFDDNLLSVKLPYLIHGEFALKRKLPSKNSDTYRFRRYDKLQTATVPLGNSGVTPAAQTLNATDVDAQINWYGTYVELNEQVTLTAQDKPLNVASNLLGISMRETQDELMRESLASTSSSVDASFGTNGDAPTEITETDVKKVVSALRANDAKTLMERIDATDRFGTGPVRNSYVALAHVDIASDLENANDFIQVARYGSQEGVLQAEFGTLNNARFFLSTKGKVKANASTLGADVYEVFFIGQEAYAEIELDNASAEFIYRPPIYSGPLALNATAGFKIASAQRLLQDDWVGKLNVTLA